MSRRQGTQSREIPQLYEGSADSRPQLLRDWGSILPGEKLAQSDTFYALIRTLQGAELSCIGGSGTAIVEKMDTVILLYVPRQNLIVQKLTQLQG